MTSQSKLVLFLSSSLLLSSFSFAVEKSPQPRDERFDDQLQLAKPDLSTQKPQISEKRDDKHTLSMTKEELAKHPDLIVRGLIPAVLQNNGDAVQLLLPLYQNLPKQDPFLLEWATAINAREEGRFSEAVTRYRTLFSQDSTILPLRYQLAQALFLNNDNEAAKDQFQKLRAEQVSPESIVMIDQYLSALNRRDQWKFQGGLSFLNESNINNAPKAGTRIGNWNAWERESATGFSYFAEAEKKWSLPHNYFTKFSIEGSGKYYWDNKKYNDLIGHIGLGYGYSDARFNMQVTPYISKRWYGGGLNGGDSLKQYTDTYGASLSMGYWLSQNFKYSALYNFGYERYRKEVDKLNYNGAVHSLTNSLMFIPSSTQFWSISLDLTKKYAADRSNAYNRIGTRLTWGQEWPLGITTSTTLGYAKRNYLEQSFIGMKQRNNEYSASVSLWHKQFHYAGFTPKVTWSYSKTKSNMAIYSYDKNQVFIEVGKSF